MSRPEPFVREAGSGRSVVCLHANASTSAQWRGLMELLAPRFHVLAIDSSATWARSRTRTGSTRSSSSFSIGPEGRQFASTSTVGTQTVIARSDSISRGALTSSL